MGFWSGMNQIDRRILDIALPAIVSNITVPLLGLVDVTIVGHLGAASYIGAIAVGGMMFSMIYWIFVFLRMGTGGLTAQAYGAGNRSEVVHMLVRSLSISLMLSSALLLFQWPIREVAFMFIDASKEVKNLASIYYHICIWGAPANFCLYSFTGWFIGMQNSRFPMFVAIVQNLVNIAVSSFLVFVLGMKVEGVALGTVIALYAGLITAAVLWMRKYGSMRSEVRTRCIFARSAMVKFFNVNKDIFLRTLCLVSVTVFFTSAGAAQGDVVLAVNTLLMQLFLLFSYIMDGFAYSAEALTGKCIGGGRYAELRQTSARLFRWGFAMALLFTLVYGVGGESFLSLLTDDSSVISASGTYSVWAMAIPLAGFSAFLLDGMFIGAAETGYMLKAMFAAAVSFFVVYYSFSAMLANHALWMAFIVYLLMRGIVQLWLGRRLLFG